MQDLFPQDAVEQFNKERANHIKTLAICRDTLVKVGVPGLAKLYIDYYAEWQPPQSDRHYAEDFDASLEILKTRLVVGEDNVVQAIHGLQGYLLIKRAIHKAQGINAELAALMSMYLSHLGHADQAVRWAKEATRITPGHYRSHLALANAYAKKGLYAAADKALAGATNQEEARELRDALGIVQRHTKDVLN